MTKKKFLAITAISSVLILVLFAFGREEKIIPENIYQPDPVVFFNSLGLEARAVYVFDALNEKIIFEKNSESQLALASLAKLMSAEIAKENIPEWQMIKVGVEAIREEGDAGFTAGEEWKISDLLDAMLVSSSNDAATAIALSKENFVSLMNQKSKELNLGQTFFFNSTGLDINGNLSGAYGSAKDIAMLMDYLLKKSPSLMEATRQESITENLRNFKNTNKIINEIPNIIASKTGFSDLAGGNLALAVDVDFGHPVIIVVLGSSEEGRFNDAKALYNEVLEYFSSQ